MISPYSSDENQLSGPAELAADGFPYVADAPTAPSDFDGQGHLNNAGVVRMLNDLRVGFVRERLGDRWTNYLRDEGLVVVVRELHVLYESEGRPEERFAGSVRIARRAGKAGIVEQRLVELTSARPLVRSWIVQLLVRDGRAVDFPDWYWSLLDEVHGTPVLDVEGERRPFGLP
jgi:acyl-CoA thioesterase FadM